MPVNDAHCSSLKCPGEPHVREHCKICRNFRPCTRLRFLLTEATVSPPLEPSHSDSALSTSAPVRSARASISDTQCCSTSPGPKKDTSASWDSWHHQSTPVPKKITLARDSRHRSPSSVPWAAGIIGQGSLWSTVSLLNLSYCASYLKLCIATCC